MNKGNIILEFFIMFLIVGMALGYIFDEKQAIVGIIVISLLWMFAYGPWAIATFIELFLGYGIMKKLKCGM